MYVFAYAHIFPIHLKQQNIPYEHTLERQY